MKRCGIWFWRAGSVAAALAIVTPLGTAGQAETLDAGPRPNIVLILSDDEDLALHDFMPKARALLHEEGTTFENAFTSYALCCPARASILRGQYAHNTQIMGNAPPWGGYEKFRALGHEESTIATWLQDAGYHTAMFGKYINRYVPDRDGVPAGWTDWYVAGNAYRSYDYDLNENGRIVTYGTEPEDYLTDVMARQARGVIEKAAAAGRPFFLYVAPFTPHSPSVAAPRHEGMFADAALPRSPAFDESDISDKPALLRELSPLDEKQIGCLEDEYRRRLASLQAIDDMVETIVQSLDATGQLDHTYIFYTSDNGFHLGEHRMPAGKDMPYEEDIRVPLVVRGPGVPAGGRLEPMILNIDLAPTFAALAGIDPPEFVDGRSFLPLFKDPEHPWRQSFLIERRQLEMRLIDRSCLARQQLAGAAAFTALRSAKWTYVEHGTGEREFYDLSADPYQLSNLAEVIDPVVFKALSSRLRQLAKCAADSCRWLEDLPLGEPEERIDSF
jgi:N-acetylglucosamine-6-sulfatase